MIYLVFYIRQEIYSIYSIFLVEEKEKYSFYLLRKKKLDINNYFNIFLMNLFIYINDKK
jgi:hypothetical protein